MYVSDTYLAAGAAWFRVYWWLWCSSSFSGEGARCLALQCCHDVHGQVWHVSLQCSGAGAKEPIVARVLVIAEQKPHCDAKRSMQYSVTHCW